MCTNCGCGNIHDDMGHPENITDKVLNALGQKWGGIQLTEVEQIVLNYLNGQKPDDATISDMEDMFTKAAKAWGQSVDEAKSETQKLLKRELS